DCQIMAPCLRRLVHASSRNAVHDDPSWPRTRGVVYGQPNNTSRGTDWSTLELAFCDFCGATTTLPDIAHGAVSTRPRHGPGAAPARPRRCRLVGRGRGAFPVRLCQGASRSVVVRARQVLARLRNWSYDHIERGAAPGEDRSLM